MAKVRVAGIVAALALLVASTAIAAGSRKLPQRGSVDGDAKASARLTVIKQGGAPKSVRNVRFKHLRADCRRGATRIELRLSGPAQVDSRRRFEKVYRDGRRHKVTLEGKVRRDGKRVRGEIRGTTIRVDGAGRCDVPSVEFTTKR